MKRSFLIFVLFACITAVGVTAYHPAFAQTQPQTLRVATHPILPFMIKQDAQWDGFSEDLWDALAERMGVNYEWVEYKNDDELVAAVQSGQADAAIAAIAMTPQREREIDFSTSYFDIASSCAVSHSTLMLSLFLVAFTEEIVTGTTDNCLNTILKRSGFHAPESTDTWKR